MRRCGVTVALLVGVTMLTTAGAAASLADPGLTATEIAPPEGGVASGGPANLNAVACPSPGSCVAVGGYLPAANDEEPLAATKTLGSWSSTALPLPANATSTLQHPQLTSIVCMSAQMCIAVGSYNAVINSTNDMENGLVETETDGSWRATSTGSLVLASVACPGAGAAWLPACNSPRQDLPPLSAPSRGQGVPNRWAAGGG